MNQLIKMLVCKGCDRVRRHGVWVYMSLYQKELMTRYYNVQWDKILCEDCRVKILNGMPLN